MPPISSHKKRILLDRFAGQLCHHPDDTCQAKTYVINIYPELCIVKKTSKSIFPLDFGFPLQYYKNVRNFKKANNNEINYYIEISNHNP